jgi:N-glycosylase/DNA lyase
LSNIKKYNKEINTLESQIDNEYKTINKLYDQYNSESDERITSMITDKIENRKSAINNLKERNKTLK